MGVSCVTPPAFVLIRSGNPEGGELAPPSCFRLVFGMSVEVAAKPSRRPKLRVQWWIQPGTRPSNADRAGGLQQTPHLASQEAPARAGVQAQHFAPFVQIDDDLRLRISSVCGDLDVDGLRGDIVITGPSAPWPFLSKGAARLSDDDVAAGGACCPAPPPAQGPPGADRFRCAGDQDVLQGVFERGEPSDRALSSLALAGWRWGCGILASIRSGPGGLRP